MEEFHKGDRVEVWDHGTKHQGLFVTINDMVPNNHPYIVVVNDDCGQATSWRNCRHAARPDLEIDDPVWVKCAGWWPVHFAGWDDNGRLHYWKFGRTSHSTEKIGDWAIAEHGEYRLTKPDEADWGPR